MKNGGGIGEEGDIGGGGGGGGWTSAARGIICVLQTEKISSERKEQFKETKIDSVSLSPFMYSNIMMQQSEMGESEMGIVQRE